MSATDTPHLFASYCMSYDDRRQMDDGGEGSLDMSSYCILDMIFELIRNKEH